MKHYKWRSILTILPTLKEPGASIAPVDGAADFASIPYEDNENGVADFAPRRKQDGASADFAAVKGNGHEKRDAGFAGRWER